MLFALICAIPFWNMCFPHRSVSHMNIASNKIVGRRIRICREQVGLSQAELGRRVGRSQSEIAKIEMGERQLPYIESFLFAEALGKRYDVLAEEVHRDLFEGGVDPS